MKIKHSNLLMVILAGLLFVIVGTLTAAEKQSVPEEIVIENESYKSDKKGPVRFSHLDHSESYDVACTECHHDYQDGKNVWKEGAPIKKCFVCHNPLKSEEKVKKLKLAFHRNCKNCHKDLAKKGISKDAPYKKCNDCHEKRS
jgi:hypothetical protein